MFKFITNYIAKKKERKAILKIRAETIGLERLTKYHKEEIHKTNILLFEGDMKYFFLDVIDTLEDHEKRIKELESNYK